MVSRLLRFLRRRRLAGSVTIVMSVGVGILAGILTSNPSIGVVLSLVAAVIIWIAIDRLLTTRDRPTTTTVTQTATGGTIKGTTIDAAGGARVTEATKGGTIKGGRTKAEGGVVSRRADAGGRLEDADVNVTDDDTLP